MHVNVWLVIVLETSLLVFLQLGTKVLPSNFLARKACHAGSGFLMSLLDPHDWIARWYIYLVVFVSLGMSWQLFPSVVPIFRFGASSLCAPTSPKVMITPHMSCPRHPTAQVTQRHDYTACLVHLTQRHDYTTCVLSTPPNVMITPHVLSTPPNVMITPHVAHATQRHDYTTCVLSTSPNVMITPHVRDAGITIYLIIVGSWFYFQQPPLALAPLFYADPAGALAGTMGNHLGLNKAWWRNKTVVGSLAVFAVAFASLSIEILWVRLFMAGLCMLAEAFGGRTYDNAVLAVPALTSWLYFHGWASADRVAQ
eukprot:g21777.t1